MTTIKDNYRIRDLVSVLVLSIVLIALIQVFVYMKKKAVYKEAEVEAITEGSKITTQMHAGLNTLINLANGIDKYIQIEEGNVDSTKLIRIIKDTKEQSDIIRNIGVAEQYILTYVYPLKNNEKALGLDYQKLPGQWPSIEKMVTNKRPVLAGPVRLVQGGKALIYRSPIFIHDQYWGLLSTVLDIEAFIGLNVNEKHSLYQDMAIRSMEIEDADNIIMGDIESFFSPDYLLLDFEIPNGMWQFAIRKTPSKAELKELRLSQTGLYFLTLMILALLLYILKLRRNSLRKNEQFKLLSENISDLIWVYDQKTSRYAFFNPNVADYFGYTQQEINNGVIHLLPHPSKYNQRVEQHIEHKNGERIWFETSTKFITEGESDKVVGITRNIEEKKRYEEKLKFSERRLQRIVDSTFAGIVIMDSEGNFVYSNPNSSKILEFEEEDLSSINLFHLAAEDEHKALRSGINKVLKKSISHLDQDVHICRNQSSFRWIHINAILLDYGQDKDKERILIVFQDITKQKRNEQELQNHIHAKNRLLSILAHDLKSPFNSIIGVQNLLVDKARQLQNEQIEKLGNLALKSSYETYNLLENLLYWSRLEENDLVPRKVSMNARDLTERVIALYRIQLDTKNIELNNFTDPDIFVDADEEMLKTVLRNLLSNAIKFSPPHGNIKIHGAIQEEGQLEIAIQDNGIGMDKQTLESLFKANKTVSRRGTEGEKGTGFGLIISKEFVELHDGEIVVESQFGLGTIFRVILPYSSENGTTFATD